MRVLTAVVLLSSFLFYTHDRAWAFGARRPQAVQQAYKHVHHAFRPNDRSPWDYDSTLKHCEDPESQNQPIRRGQDGQILPECLPDVLYSWGGMDKIEAYQTLFSPDHNKEPEPLSRPLYAWRTPIGTYAYGPYAMRIKLKEGTHFKLIRAKLAKVLEPYDSHMLCEEILNSETSRNTVLVFFGDWDDFGFLDYILCSTGPIHSWSYGTREQYDEMYRELNWIGTHEPEDYALYVRAQGYSTFFQSLDGINWDSKTLLDRFQKMYKLAAQNVGRVYFNGSYNPDDPAARAEHFATKHPTYFNISTPNY